MIQIGQRSVSSKDPAFIIAEIGSNWRTIDDAIASIQAAKDAGADAAKFQLFCHKSLYGFAGDKKHDTAHDLPIDWLPKLKQACEQVRIEFMCTAFSPEHARLVNPYVSAHKVASSDVNHVSLLKCLDQFGKPVIISTGAASETEVQMALLLAPSVPKALMYCVASYPAKSVDLTLIDKLRGLCPDVGYSDHTTDSSYIPYAAVKFHGACIVEKHFTAIDGASPDSGHSLNPSQFKAMVDKIRGNRTGYLGPTSEETDMVLRHKRRLIAIAAIKKGEVFKFDKNFGSYRSKKLDTAGLSPLMYDSVSGRFAARDIEVGDAIGAGDFN
jgi:sialic acid synthase SpsE